MFYSRWHTIEWISNWRSMLSSVSYCIPTQSAVRIHNICSEILQMQIETYVTWWKERVPYSYMQRLNRYECVAIWMVRRREGTSQAVSWCLSFHCGITPTSWSPKNILKKKKKHWHWSMRGVVLVYYFWWQYTSWGKGNNSPTFDVTLQQTFFLWLYRPTLCCQDLGIRWISAARYRCCSDNFSYRLGKAFNWSLVEPFLS